MVVLPNSMADHFYTIVSRSEVCNVPISKTSVEEDSITCLCHPSEHKRLPSIRILSSNPNDGLSLTIPPVKYLAKPFLDEDDPYNPKCIALIRSTKDSNVYLPKAIYDELNDPTILEV